MGTRRACGFVIRLGNTTTEIILVPTSITIMINLLAQYRVKDQSSPHQLNEYEKQILR